MKTVRTLSFLLAFLAAIASGGGLMLGGLYRDIELYKLLWLTNDGVTLFLAVPLLIGSIQYARRGSQRAQLLWLGLLAYLLYNYAFYLFGATFNWFFLLYAAIFALSIYALAFSFWHLDVPAISKNFSEKTPVKWIAGFLVLVALPLAIGEAGQCIHFIFTGKVPEPPSLIFALDLTLVVPNMILAAVLLWRRRAWGYVLGAMMLVKSVTYGAVLSLSATRLALSNLPEKDELLPFYVFVLVGSLVSCWALLKHLKQSSTIQNAEP